MGWRFKKSYRRGPVRFTVSKSGVSTSVGVKGARLTSGPRGTYITLGRGGLSYRHRLDSPKPSNTSQPVSPRLGESQAKPVTKWDIDNLKQSSPQELLSEIEHKHSLPSAQQQTHWCMGIVTITWFFIGMLYPDIFPLFVTLWVVVIAPLWFYLYQRAWRKDQRNKTVRLFYELDEETTALYKAMVRGTRKLASSQRIWSILTKSDVLDQKRNAGAYSSISRSNASAQVSIPKWFQSNVDVCKISGSTITLYFFPDRILVYTGNEIAALSYSQLSIDWDGVRFIEYSVPPTDAHEISKTWQYVNKDGGPDRRFKNNRQLPIMQYVKLLISSNSFEAVFYVSNLESVDVFVDSVLEYQSLLRDS